MLRCWYLKLTRRKLGEFLVHPPPPLMDSVLLIYFRRNFIDRYGVIVGKSCHSFQNSFDHCHKKTLLFQPLLLLNQAILYYIGIHPHKLKCMEYNLNPNIPALKRMGVISNQMVRLINSEYPVVLIICGSGY